MVFKTETEIIDYLRNLMDEFGYDFNVLPHQVMSHGYMAWSWLLERTFPSLSNTNTKQEFDHFCNVLFFNYPKLTKEQQDRLREDGWKAFLED